MTIIVHLLLRASKLNDSVSVSSTGGLRFEFLTGQIRRRVAYGLALLQDFFGNIVVLLAGAMTLKQVSSTRYTIQRNTTRIATD